MGHKVQENAQPASEMFELKSYSEQNPEEKQQHH